MTLVERFAWAVVILGGVYIGEYGASIITIALYFIYCVLICIQEKIKP